jgi:hypothetical protein
VSTCHRSQGERQGGRDHLHHSPPHAKTHQQRAMAEEDTSDDAMVKRRRVSNGNRWTPEEEQQLRDVMELLGGGVETGKLPNKLWDEAAIQLGGARSGSSLCQHWTIMTCAACSLPHLTHPTPSPQPYMPAAVAWPLDLTSSLTLGAYFCVHQTLNTAHKPAGKEKRGARKAPPPTTTTQWSSTETI